MMSDVVIRAEGVSKQYTLRHQRPVREGLRHRIQDLAGAPFQALSRRLRGQSGPASHIQEEATRAGQYPAPLFGAIS